MAMLGHSHRPASGSSVPTALPGCRACRHSRASAPHKRGRAASETAGGALPKHLRGGGRRAAAFEQAAREVIVGMCISPEARPRLASRSHCTYQDSGVPPFRLIAEVHKLVRHVGISAACCAVPKQHARIFVACCAL